MNIPDPTNLDSLYSDAPRCAELIGLTYATAEMPGYGRLKSGKGFKIVADNKTAVTDKKLKQRIKSLVIPPAWQQVWICPSGNGHILVTGIDEKGRKQYIYHPKWRTMRDLLKFYRMIIFATTLPSIRRAITKHLQDKGIGFDRVMAAMLWMLDNTYIRIGNDTYLAQNDTVGLSTLSDSNVVIAGSVVNISFKGKSGKDHQLVFDNKDVAEVIKEARDITGKRLFQYIDSEGKRHAVTATDLNTYLKSITNTPVSAKDFRTWGGTLMAFMHLTDNQQTSKKLDKVIVEAVDTAAGILGNTRAVAKSSYVHPHILGVYGSKNFTQYYKEASSVKNLRGLDTVENNLLHFLEILFQEEYKALIEYKKT